MKNLKTLGLTAIFVAALFGASSLISSAQTNTDSTNTLMCSPAVQNANIGQLVAFTASGGNGSYEWSSPDLSINNPTGSGFSARYASSGTKVLTVRSGSQSAACLINVVVIPTVPTTPTTPTVPGFPNTGGGYGK